MFRFFKFIIVAFPLSLCACANAPDFGSFGVASDAAEVNGTRVETVPVDLVVQHIVCEIRRADAASGGFLTKHNYIAVATLNLKVDDDGRVAPSLSFIEPFKPITTSLTFGVAGQVGQTRQRTFSEAIMIDIGKATDEKFGVTCPDNGQGITGINLTGDLGLAGVVKMGRAAAYPYGEPEAAHSWRDDVVVPVLLQNPAGFILNKPAKVPTFGSIIQFTLVKGANGGPNWVFTNFKGPVGTPLSLFNYTRTNTHQIIIAFASREEGAQKAMGPLAAVVSADQTALTSATGLISSMQINNIQLAQ